MSDYSLLPMLQRRMAEAAARRAEFPREEGALCRRLAETRENLRRCLGRMPDQIVAPEVRVEAHLELGDTKVIREVGAVYRTLGATDHFEHEARITEHDITEAFGARVTGWFDRHLAGTERS